MSEIYDATYSAIRSKTSYGDIDSAVKQAILESGISHYMDQVRASFQDVAFEMRRPSTLYKPRIFRDGNMWGCIHGENPMDGVEGYGESPEKAYEDFDKHWVELLTKK